MSKALRTRDAASERGLSVGAEGLEPPRPSLCGLWASETVATFGLVRPRRVEAAPFAVDA